jgi:acetyltransferase
MRHKVVFMITHQLVDTFKTSKGIEIRVRELLPEDAPYLVDLFEHMSAESRYRRFMEPVDQVTIERMWTEAENIAQGASGETYGLIAFADTAERPEVPVGAARYVKLTSSQAEIAVSVRDDFQNMGIGTHLFRLLTNYAAEHGINQFVGIILNDNIAMWKMLRNLGYRLERYPEGSYSQITLHIHDPRSRTEDWLDAAADFSPEPQIIG